MGARGLLSPEEIKLKPFTTHGLDFIGISGNDHQADCPFCGKPRAFHVDPDTTKWVCSSGLDKCGRTGNLQTFLRQWADVCHETTTDVQFAALSKHRDGLSVKAFKYWGVGFNPLTQDWLIPNHTINGEVHDVRRWRPKRKPMGTPTMSAGLWGTWQLNDASKKDWEVWICEGEWDGMAMWHWIRLCGLKVVVVAPPGANIFKDEWVQWFKGRNVVFWYDNDATGEGYSWKKAKQLMGVASTIRWHFWPEHFPAKYDVRDHYCRQLVALGRPPRSELAARVATLTLEHPLAKTDEDAPAPPPPPRVRPPTNPPIEATLAVYRRHLKMSRDLEDAAKVLFACTFSQQLKLDVPAWLFLVGPPASGKTALLLSLHKVPDVSYHSNITAKALLSGFKEEKKEEDPSVLLKLIKAGVGVFKDFTQLLGKSNEMELQAVMRLLRGAFDGEAEQHFGNGVVRKYKGSFTLLAGVTDEIHAYSEATVGERFLKFQLQSLSRRREDELLREIVLGSKNREKASEELQDAAAAFLDRDVKIESLDPNDVLPQEFVPRIIGLGRMIAKLRHQVSWERDFGYDKVLRFKPREESPARVVRQLTSVALSLCEVHGHRRYGHAEHRLVERVAFDTAIGFNLDIIEAMMAMNHGVGIARGDLVEATGIPRTTLSRRLEDMQVTKQVVPSAKQPQSVSVGRQPEHFDVAEELRELWRQMAPGESHLASAAAARKTRQGGIHGR